MSNNFYVGQQVCCVDSHEDFFPFHKFKHLNFKGNMDGLEKGKIYTVRKIGIDPLTQLFIIFLVEIIRPNCEIRNMETGYLASRFRPLVKTDISIFQAMLNPTPKRVDA